MGLTSFRRDPLAFLTRLAHRHGDVASFRLGAETCVLVNHPDHIREVLVTNHANFPRGGPTQRRSPVLGEGLLTSEPSLHRRHRGLMRPAFHRDRIAVLAGGIVRRGDEFTASRWRHGESREMLPEMRRLSLAVMLDATFGPDAARDDGAMTRTIVTAIERLGRFGKPRHVARVPVSTRGRTTAAVARLIKQLDAPVTQLITQRRREGIDHSDLLSTLLSARDEAGGLTDDEVRDEVRTLLEAGHVAVANALTWTWYLLAGHPAIEKKMHAELDGVLDGRPPGLDDLPRLPYTEMVFLEALRLYPPGWLLSRRVVSDYLLGGYTLAADSSVLVCPYVMHRDTRYYSDPHRFEPGRWTPEARAARPTHAYLPFSFGPQRCLGDGLAMVEGVLLLATIGRTWAPRLTTTRPPALMPVLTLVPASMRLRLERRRP